MRTAATLLFCLLATFSRAADRILLVPLDSRPATGQFSQMIAKIAGVDVKMPPYDALGRFTQPGDPERILEWLEGQDLEHVFAVVASADMLAYGGLVASRDNRVSEGLAVSRLMRFARFRAQWPKVRFYVSSSTMRLAPTATRAAAPWRMRLADYYDVKDRWERTGDRTARAKMQRLRPLIPSPEIVRYETTRLRNHKVQRELVRMAAQGAFDFLAIGQDDARQFGPFVRENARLAALVRGFGVGSRVFFCEGIDQHANVLVSRAILQRAGRSPAVRVVYGDRSARFRLAAYESKPIEASLQDQILASGARLVEDRASADYTLYLHTPGCPKPLRDGFLREMAEQIDAGDAVALADIDLGATGTGNPAVLEALVPNDRMVRLLSYSGWNTAGNTMGTAIPAANMVIAARGSEMDPVESAVAQREFLLHRLVNDFNYHRFTRPVAYAMIDSDPRASREETYGQAFNEINDFVRRDMLKQIDRVFGTWFLGRTFQAGGQEHRINGLVGVGVFLPWPRVYEVRLQFRITTDP